MADRYIILGASFNGDGTSSAEATSNGGVGAWNQQSILTGTAPSFGTLGAGDVVFIRCKTSGGANITISHTAASTLTIGNASATATAPICWVLDNGTVWSGVTDGTLTFENSNVSGVLQIIAHNEFSCDKKSSLRFVGTVNGTASGGFLSLANGATVVRPYIDTTAKTASGSGWAISLGISAMLVEPEIRWGLISDSSQPGVFACTGRATIVNPDVELTSSAGSGTAVFNPPIGDSHMVVYGGRVWGTGAIAGRRIAQNLGNSVSETLVTLHGTEYPRVMTLPSNGTADSNSYFTSFGADGGVGSTLVLQGGVIDSRTDGLYPTLNATLPDSLSTKWSWLIYPQFASTQRRMMIPINKYYSASPATVTIELEILVPTTMTGATKRTVYMNVDYTDNSSGTKKYVSTYAVGALTSSSADWQPNVGGNVSYGSTAFDKRKLSVTLPTSVKQNTLITAVLHIAVASASASEILIVDPDLQIV